jgi:D-alanyl-D-alanine carboxypeptidase
MSALFLSSIVLVSQNVDSTLVYNETFFADSTKFIDHLAKQIDSILSNKYLKNSKFSVAVYSLTNNKFYYTKDIDLLLTPASLTKLFTTYNALSILGKNYNVKTTILTDGTMNKDTLIGNIFVRGGGDVLFRINDMEALADKVINSGIKYIKGNIYPDGSFFDKYSNWIDYSGDKEVVEPTPPITSLIMDRNTVTILVTAGAKPGEKVNVHFIPNSEYFQKNVTAIVKSTAKKAIPKKNKKKSKKLTSTPHINSGLKDENDFENRAGDELIVKKKVESKGVIKITSKESGNKQNFYVSGSLKPNSSYSYSYHISNPYLAFAGAFKERLKSGGVKVFGKIDVIDSLKNFKQSEVKAISDFQRPIIDIIKITNKESDNYFAETIFKIMGGEKGIIIDNHKNIESIIDSNFSRHGITCNDCQLHDGSGLSRHNLITTRGLVNLLSSAYNSDFKQEFKESLSIASVDGTLRKRMKYSPAESNLTAKTGTLRNVSGLAGYVTTLDGEHLAFAFVFNGDSVGLYKALENQLGGLLAGFYIHFPELNNKKIK